MSFVGNEASIGATVFWFYDPQNMPTEPPGLQSSTLNWMDNRAPYGVKWGTQTSSLVAANDTLSINAYKADDRIFFKTNYRS